MNKYYPSLVRDPSPVLSILSGELDKSKQIHIKEISIEIKTDSAFLLLPSPLVQRAVLQRMYHSFSNRETLSYESTCQILALINEKNNFGKREKVLHLDKEISIVKIGDYLIFTREKLRILNNKNKTNDKIIINNTENVTENDDFEIVKNEHQGKKSEMMRVGGIRIEYPKV